MRSNGYRYTENESEEQLRRKFSETIERQDKINFQGTPNIKSIVQGLKWLLLEMSVILNSK